MPLGVSDSDRSFVDAFEQCAIGTAEFDHAAHLRVAYVYLCETSSAAASDRMKDSLLNFLAHINADPGKYHMTLTVAWMHAVRHFMKQTRASSCFADFIDRHPVLLDPEIMLTHYTAGTLFSDTARTTFVAPDIEPIPS